MVGVKGAPGLALFMAAAVGLAGCDNGPSAVHAKSGSSAAAESASGEDGARSGYAARQAGEAGIDHRKDPVKLVEGKPLWSPSRRFSAEENAQRAFERNGAAFGARDEAQFIRKAHDFVDHPPSGTLTLSRANGDTLYYDPKGNVFAVAGKDGAPRTMFKPDDGMAYWEKQKDRESKRQTARRARAGGDDQA
jgi:pyocin large subunit-like protein